jgi:hypothetical protein
MTTTEIRSFTRDGIEITVIDASTSYVQTADDMGYSGLMPSDLPAPTSGEREMPALNGEVVTQRHADLCAERGHAYHMVDGIAGPTCPRCGESTTAAEAADVAEAAAREAWLPIAEAARQAHHLAAAQDDGAVYMASQKAFRAVLDAAWPQYGSNVLYALWLDSMESVEYYVTNIRNGTIDPEEWNY